MKKLFCLTLIIVLLFSSVGSVLANGGSYFQGTTPVYNTPSEVGPQAAAIAQHPEAQASSPGGGGDGGDGGDGGGGGGGGGYVAPKVYKVDGKTVTKTEYETAVRESALAGSFFQKFLASLNDPSKVRSTVTRTVPASQPGGTRINEFNFQGTWVPESKGLTDNKITQEQRQAQNPLSLREVARTVLPLGQGRRESRERVEAAVEVTNACLQGGGRLECAARSETVANLSQAEKNRLNQQIDIQRVRTAVVELTRGCQEENAAACEARDSLQELSPEVARIAEVTNKALETYGSQAFTTLSGSEELTQIALLAATGCINNTAACVGQTLARSLPEVRQQTVDQVSREVCRGEAACTGEVVQIVTERPAELQRWRAEREFNSLCDASCQQSVGGVSAGLRDEIIEVAAAAKLQTDQKQTAVSTAQIVTNATQTIAAASQIAVDEYCSRNDLSCAGLDAQVIFNEDAQVSGLDPHDLAAIRRIARDNLEAIKGLPPIDTESDAYRQFVAAVDNQPVIPGLTQEQIDRVYPGIRSVGQGGVPTAVERVQITPATLLQGQVEAERGVSLGYVQSQQGQDLLAGKPFARFALENPVIAGRVGNFLTNGVTLLAGAGESITALPKYDPRGILAPMTEAFQTVRENNQELAGLRGVERRAALASRAEAFVTDRATYESCNSGAGACAAWQAYNIINQAAARPGANQTTQIVAQQAAANYLLDLESQRQDAITADVVAGVGSFFGGVASPSIGVDLLVGQIAGAGQTILREIFVDTPQEALARAERQYLRENRSQIDVSTQDFLRRDAAATFREGVTRAFQNVQQQAQVGGGIDLLFASAGNLVGRATRTLSGTPTEAAGVVPTRVVTVDPRVRIPAEVTPRLAPTRAGGVIGNLTRGFEELGNNFEDAAFDLLGVDIGRGIPGLARRSDVPGGIGGGVDPRFVDQIGDAIQARYPDLPIEEADIAAEKITVVLQDAQRSNSPQILNARDAFGNPRTYVLTPDDVSPQNISNDLVRILKDPNLDLSVNKVDLVEDLNLVPSQARVVGERIQTTVDRIRSEGTAQLIPGEINQATGLRPIARVTENSFDTHNLTRDGNRLLNNLLRDDPDLTNSREYSRVVSQQLPSRTFMVRGGEPGRGLSTATGDVGLSFYYGSNLDDLITKASVFNPNEIYIYVTTQGTNLETLTQQGLAELISGDVVKLTNPSLLSDPGIIDEAAMRNLGLID